MVRVRVRVRARARARARASARASARVGARARARVRVRVPRPGPRRSERCVSSKAAAYYKRLTNWYHVQSTTTTGLVPVRVYVVGSKQYGLGL